MLIYGAYGYTGELVAREAARRGLRPILAGRRKQPLERLASELDLEARTFGLDDPSVVARALADARVVIHCAGPFEATAEPMARACLATGTHYLDITGEMVVFAALHRLDGPAHDRGVMLLPGAGFDVVPSDCLAAHLARRLPGARRLLLAFQGIGKPSRGTLSTMAMNLHRGGAIRRDGRIVPVPAGWRVRWVDFGRGPVMCVSIPWGDVYTAHVSTGIPDIEVYMAASRKLIRAVRLSRWLRPLLAPEPVRRALVRRIRRGRPGPTREERERGRSLLWGAVEDGQGRRVVARLRCPEGYTLTALAAVEIARRVEAGGGRPGFVTPSLAFGPEFVTELPGCVLEDVDGEEET